MNDDIESVVSTDSTDTLTTETEVEGNNITVNVVVPESSSVAESPLEVTDDISEDDAQSVTVQTFSTYSLDESASDSGNTVSNVIIALFGEYTPKTQTVTEYLADGSSISYQQYVPGIAGLDWDWLTGVLMFSICLLSFFRLLGGVLKRG